MDFYTYIGNLEEFVSKDYSLDRDFLQNIERWSCNERYSPKDNNELIEQGFVQPSYADNFLSLGLKGNYSIKIDNSSPLSYDDIVDDFKTKPIGNHSWRWKGYYPSHATLYNGFISDSLAMFLQIEKKLTDGSFTFDIEKDKKIHGYIEFMFPGTAFISFKEGTKFNWQRDLANSIIALSKYIREKELPTRIDLCSNYHYRAKKLDSIIYNPKGVELKYINTC